MEIELDSRFTNTLSASAQVVFTSSHFRGSVATPAIADNDVPQVPKVQGGVALTWADPRWFTAATQIRFSGEQFDDDLNTEAFILGAYAVWDATVSRAIVRGLNAFLAVENILDTGIRHRAHAAALDRLAAHRPRRRENHLAVRPLIVLLAIAAARRGRIGAGPSEASIRPASARRRRTRTSFVMGRRCISPARWAPMHRARSSAPACSNSSSRCSKNLEIALKSQGADFSHVAKMTIYTTDVDAFRSPEAAKIRTKYLGSNRPASTLVGVVRLATLDYKVEIEAIAVLP